MHYMNEYAVEEPGFAQVLVEDDELMQVTDEFIERQGYVAVRHIDTPSFMRVRTGELVSEPFQKSVSTEVPEPVLDLLRVLFKEDENDFTFTSGSRDQLFA